MIVLLLLAAQVVGLFSNKLDPNHINQCPQPTQTNPDPPEYVYAHPDDCSYYFICAYGKPHLKRCKPHGQTGYSEFYHTCVALNTFYDTCTRLNAQRECGRGMTGLIGHPTLCHRYYNCSQTPSRLHALLGDYEAECSYPKRFDLETSSCVSAKEATCGPHRLPPIDPCDYISIQCKDSSCPPCSNIHNSCIGLADGFNSFPGREWTKSYISCHKGKLTKKLVCRNHEQTGTEAFFSPDKKKCVSRWEVPRNTGHGLAPSCEGKRFGLYKVTERDDVYYSCPAADVFYCEPGTFFSEVSHLCEAPGIRE